MDICGNIPLHYAVSFGGNTVFDYVLFATKNINVVNEDCENALHLTPQNRTTYKAAMLIQSGIHINQLNLPSGYDEVTLIRDSCLFVVNASGPMWLSYLFGVKTLSVDHPCLTAFDWQAKGACYATKYLYSLE